jgi:hypothetical protein
MATILAPLSEEVRMATTPGPEPSTPSVVRALRDIIPSDRLGAIWVDAENATTVKIGVVGLDDDWREQLDSLAREFGINVVAVESSISLRDLADTYAQILSETSVRRGERLGIRVDEIHGTIHVTCETAAVRNRLATKYEQPFVTFELGDPAPGRRHNRLG